MNELDKFGKESEKYIALMEFYQFISMKELNICKFSDELNQFMPITDDIQDLIYEFLGVDKVKLEKERRELLDSLGKD